MSEANDNVVLDYKKVRTIIKNNKKKHKKEIEKARHFPRKVIVFENLDKKSKEKWTKSRDLLNIPAPSRITIAGSPNSGKTNLVKNLLVRANPPYKKIYLVHYDQETEEYDDIPEIIKLDDFPNPRDRELFNGVDKCCLIIDDYEFKFLSKTQLKNLDRLLGFCSSHLYTTILICCQDWFNLPPIIRRSSNVFFVWKNTADLESLYMIGRKFNYKKQEFMDLFKHCKCKYDFLCFDKTNDTPAPVRLNGYEILKNPETYDS